MSRQRSIIALMGMLFAMQAALLVYLHFHTPLASGGSGMATSIIVILVTGLVDAGSTYFLLSAIRHSEEANAAQISLELERSLANYQTIALQEERMAMQIGGKIEEEMSRARMELAQGNVGAVEACLQQGLDMASEAQPPLCESATISAILESRRRQCSDDGIGLVAKVALPDQIGIPDVEIAAVVFSLIEAARNACLELRAEGPGVTAPSIVVRMLVDVGHLVIEVACTSQALTADTRKKLDIQTLSHDIQVADSVVQRHGGLVETSVENGLPRITALIPLASASEATG